MFKKLMSLLLLLATLLSFSTAVYAEEQETVSGVIAEQAENVNFFSTAYNPLKTVKDFTGRYGDQLGASAKKMYDGLVNYYTKGNTGDYLHRLSSPVTFYAAIVGGSIQETKEFNNAYRKCIADFQAAIDAFIYDYPEMFWIYSGIYQVSYSVSADSSSPTGWMGKIESICFEPQEAYPNAIEDISRFVRGVDRAVGLLSSQLPDATEYDRIKQIHDYVCGLIQYDFDYPSATDYRTYCPVSSFIDSKPTGVCECYAETFKILCDRFGIPCICVAGQGVTSSGSSNHMWNFVKLDGKWYLVDATWDDQSEIRYEYFLVGSYSVGFNNVLVKNDHKPDGKFSLLSVSSVFAYPDLSDGHYHLLRDHVVAASINADGYIEHLCTLCNKSVGKDPIFSIGQISLSNIVFKHNATVQKPSVTVVDSRGNVIDPTHYTLSWSNANSSDPGEYSVTVNFKGLYTGSERLIYRIRNEYLAGDISQDDEVNATDVLLLKQYMSYIGTLDESQIELADFNKDGYCDALDLTLLSRMVLKIA